MLFLFLPHPLDLGLGLSPPWCWDIAFAGTVTGSDEGGTHFCFLTEGREEAQPHPPQPRVKGISGTAA